MFFTINSPMANFETPNGCEYGRPFGTGSWAVPKSPKDRTRTVQN